MGGAHKRNGFSLIELMVSTTVIAILTVIGVVSYSSVNKRSRDVKRKSDIEQIRSALEMYRSDYGYYPNVEGGSWGTADVLGPSLVTTYMPVIPADPQVTQFKYYYFKAKNLQAGNYYGYCMCACLESSPCDTLISNTCDASDLRPDNSCNYYLKNP